MNSFGKMAAVVAALGLGAAGFAVDQQIEQQPPAPADGTVYGDLQRLRPATPYVPPRNGTNPGATSARGHYKTLLTTIDVPGDRETYGDFNDAGYWPGISYAGHDNLPPGYWVYLAPKWYIFKEAAGPAQGMSRAPRAWGPEQATGKPDTWPSSGDIGTAWASQTPDGQREWLELTYKTPTRPIAVLVYETYNPGAVDRVTAYDAAGKEVELWSGADPTPAGQEKGVSVIPVHPAFDVSRIRIYLDSPKVPGWNEIDAVGLLNATGKTAWAASATASSSYADSSVPSPELLDLKDKAPIDRFHQPAVPGGIQNFYNAAPGTPDK